MRKIFTYLFVFSASLLVAQDIHFSQYWTTPLAVNPSNTGKFNGKVRATFNYRNQWFLIPTQNAVSPYQTYQASVDVPIFSERLENNGFGLGATFFNDKAGDGALMTNCALISAAYHQGVDRWGRSHLSFGLQAGVVSKQIKMNDLVFETQLDNYGWNKNLYNGEVNYTNKSIIYPDVNVGAMFTSRIKDNFKFNLGFTCAHVASPKESFLKDDKNRLGRRYVAHGGAEVSVGYDKQWTISPTFLFMMQSNAQEYNFGLGVNYEMNDNIALFGGGFTRVNTLRNWDAGIVQIGVDAYHARIGISYDINTSTLRGASKAQGAVEVTATYILGYQKDEDLQYPKYNPKF